MAGSTKLACLVKMTLTQTLSFLIQTPRSPLTHSFHIPPPSLRTTWRQISPSFCRNSTFRNRHRSCRRLWGCGSGTSDRRSPYMSSIPHSTRRPSKDLRAGMTCSSRKVRLPNCSESRSRSVSFCFCCLFVVEFVVGFGLGWWEGVVGWL